MEVITKVIGKMNLGHELAKKHAEKKVSKVLVITKARITIPNSGNFKHKFYELKDTQFNLYMKLVKEELS